MDYYSYKLVRDYGFAPNPFGGICTLATCKPGIRKSAQIDDWILGNGGKTLGWDKRLIYLMKVTDKITFNEYWNDKKYQFKKPVINGSLVKIHGDNIYHKDDKGHWFQENSHHSFEDGINIENLKKDISGEFVLISAHFFYFGSFLVKIPKQFSDVVNKGRNVKKIKDTQLAEDFVGWIETAFRPRYIYGNPINWSQYSQMKLRI